MRRGTFRPELTQWNLCQRNKDSSGTPASCWGYAPTGKYRSARDSTCKMNGMHPMILRRNLSVEDIKTFLF